MTGDRPTLTLSRLRDEPSADLTLRNLMDALTLVYDLRARYRVFEFEAAHEGAESCAELFAALSEVEGTQIRALMQGLRERLAIAEHAAGEPAVTAGTDHGKEAVLKHFTTGHGSVA